MAPSSRFAASLQPSVAYLVLNFCALVEADDLAVLGMRGHPVPESRREGWRAGFDDGMEPLDQGARGTRLTGPPPPAQRKIRDQARRQGGSSPATHTGRPMASQAPRPEAPATGPLTWPKRRGTYTPVCRGRLPIPQRRFDHAKGMTRATCHGEQTMYAESFGSTDASGPSHSMPCPAFSSSRPVRNVFRCACGRGRQRLC
jgi:hypothetical protein